MLVTCLMHMRDVTHLYVCISFHVCAMSHSHAWHVDFQYVAGLIQKCEITCWFHDCDMTDSYQWVTGLIHMFDVTHLSVLWLVHMCDVADACVCQVSFACEAWLIHVCDMPHSFVWYVSFTCMPHDSVILGHDSVILVTRLIHVCAMTGSRAHRASSKATRLFLTK